MNSKLLNLIRQWTKKSLGWNQSILYFQQGIKYFCWYSLKYDFHKVSAGINVSRKFLLAKTLKVICRRPAKINSAEKCRRQIVVAFSFLKILKWFPFSQSALSKVKQGLIKIKILFANKVILKSILWLWCAWVSTDKYKQRHTDFSVSRFIGKSISWKKSQANGWDLGQFSLVLFTQKHL